MLVLSRKTGEAIVIGDNIVISVNRIAGNRVVLGIEAPAEVPVRRNELAANDAANRKWADNLKRRILAGETGKSGGGLGGYDRFNRDDDMDEAAAIRIVGAGPLVDGGGT